MVPGSAGRPVTGNLCREGNWAVASFVGVGASSGFVRVLVPVDKELLVHGDAAVFDGVDVRGGVFQKVVVEPAVNFSRLKEVFVVTESPDPAEKNRSR